MWRAGGERRSRAAGALSVLLLLGGSADAHRGSALARARGHTLSAIVCNEAPVGGFSPEKLINDALVSAGTADELLGIVAEQGSSFNAVNEATALSRLSKVRIPPQLRVAPGANSDVQALLGQIEGRLREDGYDSRALASIAHAMAKLRLGPGASSSCEGHEVWPLLSERTMQHIDKMDPQGIANTAWAFASAGVLVPELFDAIGRSARERVDSFDAQALANTAWAFATMGVQAPGLFDAIARTAEERADQFDPQGIANTLWAFATLGVHAPALFCAMARSAERIAETFNSQGLANTVWAFATAGQHAPSTFDTFAHVAERRIHEFNSQGLATTAWAYASLGVSAPALFAAIGRAAVSSMDEFDEKGVTMVAWSFASAGVHAPELFAAIALSAEQYVDKFRPHGLTTILWAFATLGYHAPALFDAAGRAIEQRPGDFESRALTNAAWAFATLGVPRPTLFSAIAREAERRMYTYDTVCLARIAWSFATARMRAPTLFHVIARYAQRQLESFSPQGISIIAWAFATLHVHAPALFDDIASATKQRMDEFSTHSIANVIWAISLVDDISPYVDTLLLLVQRALEEPADTAGDSMVLAKATSYAGALLTLRMFAGSHTEMPVIDALLVEVRSRIDAVQPGGLAYEATSSRSHLELSKALRAAGWEHELEVALGGGLLIVDMACERTRVAVEFDGPMHFMTDVLTREESHDGSTRWKTRVLEALGWRVYRVGWREWAGQPILGGRPASDMQREHFVLGLVKSIHSQQTAAVEG